MTLQPHDNLNAEGYCKVCHSPLDIAGTCFTCLINETIQPKQDDRTQKIKEYLDSLKHRDYPDGITHVHKDKD